MTMVAAVTVAVAAAINHRVFSSRDIMFPKAAGSFGFPPLFPVETKKPAGEISPAGKKAFSG